MNKQVTAYALIFLAFIVSQSAFAADRVSNWAGFYVGGNAGYAWGNANSSLAIADGPLGGIGGNCHFCSPLSIAAGGLGGNDVGLAQNAGSPNFNLKGFTGGGQFGYNWQRSNWVYGIEADFEGFSQGQTVNNSVSLPTNTAAVLNCFAGVGLPCVGNFSTSVKADWLVTIRPRIGYAWDQSLAYVTGGLAISRLSFSQNYNDNLNFGSSIGGSESASVSQIKAGWVLGAGFEQAMGNNWSLKAEYLYVRFNGLNANGRLTDSFTPTTGEFANFTNNVDHFSSNIVRVGFNYKFSAAATKY
jgi:outer membrane immunogenic protein